MNRLLLLLVILLGGFLGCASPQPLPQNADHGVYPDDYERLVEEFYEDKLLDAESARFLIGAPRKAYLNAGAFQGGGIEWVGYAVEVKVNSRNDRGAYTGYRNATLMIRDGRVTRAVKDYEFAEMFHWVDG